MKIAPPHRVRRSYVQQLVAPPAAVFPLLCPVREADWIEGWDPLAVWSASGVAEVDCVFTTAAPAGGTHAAIWYVTRHEPESGFVEMLKITPGVTACRLTIELRPAPSGCEATITYTHTSLGPAGDDLRRRLHGGALSPVHAGLGGATEPLPADRYGAFGGARLRPWCGDAPRLSLVAALGEAGGGVQR